MFGHEVMMVWYYVVTTQVVICHKCITMGSDQLMLGVSTRTGVQAMLDVDRVFAWGQITQFLLCLLLLRALIL